MGRADAETIPLSDRAFMRIRNVGTYRLTQTQNTTQQPIRLSPDVPLLEFDRIFHKWPKRPNLRLCCRVANVLLNLFL